jgi:hypothetical protein
MELHEDGYALSPWRLGPPYRVSTDIMSPTVYNTTHDPSRYRREDDSTAPINIYISMARFYRKKAAQFFFDYALSKQYFPWRIGITPHAII